MLRFVAYALLCVALIPATANAVEVDAIVGNRALTTGTIHTTMASEAESGAAVRQLQELYYARGYFSVRIEVTANGRGVKLAITEGEQARVGLVNVRGADPDREATLRSALGLVPGEPFAPSQFDAATTAWLRKLDQEGLPFAQVWVDSLRFRETTGVVDIALYVSIGDERRVRNILVEGDHKTRDDRIVRLAGLTPGSRYRGAMLDEAVARLALGDIFDDVAYPELRVVPGSPEVDVVLHVSERKRANSLQTAIGYASETDQDREVSGLVHLVLNNLGGTLRDLDVYWANDGRDRSETCVEYRDRFFLGRPLQTALRIEQIGVDTLYTWQSLGVEVSRNVGRIGPVAVSGIVGVNADRNVFSIGDLQRSWRYRYTVGAAFARGYRRSPVFQSVELRASLARKQNTFRNDQPGTDVQQWLYRVRARSRASFIGPTFLLNELYADALESDERLVVAAEEFFLGGAASLRGFRENQFSGHRAGVLRNAIQFGENPDENLYVFADVGYVERRRLNVSMSVETSDNTEVGYGFGVKTLSRFGTIDLSFGVGEKLSLQTTKLHVLLEQSF